MYIQYSRLCVVGYKPKNGKKKKQKTNDFNKQKVLRYKTMCGLYVSEGCRFKTQIHVKST